MGKYIFLIVFWIFAILVYAYIRIRIDELLQSLKSIVLDMIDKNKSDDYHNHLLKKLISKRVNNIDKFISVGGLYTFVIGLMIGTFILASVYIV